MPLAEHRRAPAMPDLDFTPAHATLRNGTPFTVRALRPADRERIAAALRGLSPETIYTRLFSHRKLTESALVRVMHTDPTTEVALVATVGDGTDEIIIGGCRYIVMAARPVARAEVAFTVEEDYQGQGVAGQLLAALTELARRRGIAMFEAQVLAENPPMLRVFERCGLPITRRREGDVVHLELSLRHGAGLR